MQYTQIKTKSNDPFFWVLYGCLEEANSCITFRCHKK